MSLWASQEPSDEPGQGRGREGSPSLRRYAWLIVTIAVVTIVGATSITAEGIMALHPSNCTSSSMVVVAAKSTNGIHVLPDMDAEQQVAFSDAVASRASHRLGLSPSIASSGLWVSVRSDTSVLDISYSSGSPREAFAGAAAFTKAYVTYRNEQTNGLDVAVITNPALPTKPTGTNFPLAIGLSLLIGAMIGVVGLAWRVGRSHVGPREPSGG